jgi:hypothetical protein
MEQAEQDVDDREEDSEETAGGEVAGGEAVGGDVAAPARPGPVAPVVGVGDQLPGDVPRRRRRRRGRRGRGGRGGQGGQGGPGDQGGINAPPALGSSIDEAESFEPVAAEPSEDAGPEIGNEIDRQPPGGAGPGLGGDQDGAPRRRRRRGRRGGRGRNRGKGQQNELSGGPMPAMPDDRDEQPVVLHRPGPVVPPRRRPPPSNVESRPAPQRSSPPQPVEPVVRTGSTDRHLVSDEPVVPQPTVRPRSYQDLDAIPDDFD